jgi:hypothetical protein
MRRRGADVELGPGERLIVTTPNGSRRRIAVSDSASRHHGGGMKEVPIDEARFAGPTIGFRAAGRRGRGVPLRAADRSNIIEAE